MDRALQGRTGAGPAARPGAAAGPGAAGGCADPGPGRDSSRRAAAAGGRRPRAIPGLAQCPRPLLRAVRVLVRASRPVVLVGAGARVGQHSPGRGLVRAHHAGGLRRRPGGPGRLPGRHPRSDPVQTGCVPVPIGTGQPLCPLPGAARPLAAHAAGTGLDRGRRRGLCGPEPLRGLRAPAVADGAPAVPPRGARTGPGLAGAGPRGAGTA